MIQSVQTLASKKVCSDTALGELPEQVSAEVSQNSYENANVSKALFVEAICANIGFRKCLQWHCSWKITCTSFCRGVSQNSHENANVSKALFVETICTQKGLQSHRSRRITCTSFCRVFSQNSYENANVLESLYLEIICTNVGFRKGLQRHRSWKTTCTSFCRGFSKDSHENANISKALFVETVCANVGFRKGLQWHRSRIIPAQVSVEDSLRTLTKTQRFRKRSLWKQSAQMLASEKVCSGTAVGKLPARTYAEVSLRTLTKTQIFQQPLCGNNLHKGWLPKRFAVAPLSKNYLHEFL